MDPSSVDRLLAQAVDDQVVPGVVAVAADREGVLYERAFGRLSADGDEPVRPNTMFWLASMTKPFVSVAALQLVERGELELEQSVAEVLPEFGALKVLEGFEGDTPRLRGAKSRATVRNLLTHTAGASYWFSNPDLLRYHEVTGVPHPGSHTLASLFEVPLVADPGTRWEYGTNTDWLGLLLERVSGRTLAELCAENIFGPLGMPDTTFTPTQEQSSRMMHMHSRAADGTLTSLAPAMPKDFEFYSGGGGSSGTGLDYLRFLRALLRGGELDGERILRKETVELAFADQLRGLPLPPGMRSAVPELTNDVPALPFAEGWGLGFHLILEDIPQMRRAGTGNWAGLANCYFWIDHSSGVAAAIFTQVLPFFDARIVGLTVEFEQAIHALVGEQAAR